MFQHGQIYYANLFFFLIGAIVPIPIYFLAKRYPGGPWKLMNVPLFFSATGAIPPATAIKYLLNLNHSNRPQLRNLVNRRLHIQFSH